MQLAWAEEYHICLPSLYAHASIKKKEKPTKGHRNS